ncbi:MAG TPA: purine-nucleoside phosphorylase [Alphaproteobacteria bacterium]|nr:purine-nucleoside phosphorylase [Alphaproteobacteria bacterium]
MKPGSPHDAASAIAARASGLIPRFGLVLGSGLGAVAEAIRPTVRIGYVDIPGFPESAVAGHAGQLVLGYFESVPVACMMGRAHLYEGTPVDRLRVPIRALRLLGCEAVVLTNAAGGLKATLPPGRLMIVADHINMMGVNPLVGDHDDEFGPRFPSLDGLYDETLRDRFRRAAAYSGVGIGEGVYLATLGPSFETAAEIRAFRTLGADAVGMSTVPEAILARHCGMKVAAISVITNPGTGLGPAAHGHETTLAHAARAAGDLARLLRSFFAGLAYDG